jgi:hypothetical protein
MAKDTHVTAPTRFVEANGVRYAYRCFSSGRPPRLGLSAFSVVRWQVESRNLMTEHVIVTDAGGTRTLRMNRRSQVRIPPATSIVH